MFSAWRDIAVFVDETESGDRIARQAAVLAKHHQAHLVGVFGIAREPSHPSESFARGEQAIDSVLLRRRQQDQARALEAGRQFGDLLREYEVGSEFRVVWRGETAQDAVLSSLNCDLIVASHPQLDNLPDGWSSERLLLLTGAPVVRIPREWGDRSVGKTVMIAWNGSREGRRAVNDAMPLLVSADSVTILIVDGDRDPRGTGGQDGADLLRHLQRHDVQASVEAIDSDGQSVADVILAQVAARAADLLVIGAYSHPRSMEILFGGVTRSLLADAAVPLLMSR